MLLQEKSDKLQDERSFIKVTSIWLINFDDKAEIQNNEIKLRYWLEWYCG